MSFSDTRSKAMGHLTEFESPSNNLAGVYRQNAFYIKMSSLFDLEPSEGEPPAAAVAMHAHEYVHFLHNASTTAGQAYLLSNLILLRTLASGCDDQGYFCGIDCMTEEQRKSLHYVGTLMRAQLGATAANQLAACMDIRHWECESPQVNTSDGISTAIAVFNARDTDSEPQSQSIEIGLSFITEGVAYEVEREMRRLGGTSEHHLDAHTNVFPYLAFRVLVRSWSGRELTSQEYIAIGVAALANQFAGFWLATICLALKNDTGLLLEEALDKAHASCSRDSKHVLALLREQRRDLSKGDVIWTAVGEYMKLAEAGAQLRQKVRIPEFAFLSRTLTPEEFRLSIGNMLDCLIIQEKPCETTDIYWIGPGLAAQTDEMASCLGALQSALHFSQIHLLQDGSVIQTEALNPPHPVLCPFAGGCEVERLDQHPTDCRSAPWKRFAFSRLDEKVCWYAAGVKGLRNPTHVP